MMATPPQFEFQPQFSIDDDFNEDFSFNDDPFDLNPAEDYDPLSFELTDPHLEAAHSSETHESARYFDGPAIGMVDSIEAAPKPHPENIQTKGNMSQQREHVHVMTPPTSLSPDGSFNIPNTKKRKATSDVSEGVIEAHDPSAEKKAKNRVAAAKCREKKKGQQKDLIEDLIVQERENKRLKKMKDDLKEEMLSLKNSLLLHAECGNHAIDQWHQRRAERLSRGQVAIQPVAQTPRMESVSPSRHSYGGRSRAVSVEPLAQSGGSQPAGSSLDLDSRLEFIDSPGSPGSAIHYYHEPQNPLSGGAMMSRTASQHSTIDVLANAAVGRAYTASLPHQPLPGHNDRSPRHDPDHQYQYAQHQVRRSSVMTFPADVRNSIEAAPYDSSMGSDVTFDPDLHHGGQFIELSHLFGADAEEIVVDQTEVED